MKIIAAALLLVLAGCSTLPQGYYYRAKDGIRADANTEVLADFDRAKAICNGKASAAALGVTRQATMINTNIELVFRGCLAEQGYVVR